MNPKVRRPAKRLPGAALMLTAAFLPGMAFAQDEDAQLAAQGRLTVGQQIALDNGNLMGITPIDILLRTGTRTQRLEFSASLPINEDDPDEEDFFSAGDRQARLYWQRGVRNSSIEAEATYRESDLDREILFDEESETLVEVDRGRVAYSRARLGYAFGSQAKLGGELGLAYNRRDYTDLPEDSNLYDSQTRTGDLTLFLEPTPLVRARILGSSTRIESDGGTNSRSSRMGLGASVQVDKLTNLDLEVAETRISRDYNDGREEETSGPAYSLNMSRALPAGDLTFGYNSDPGTEGRRQNITLGRSLERPRYNLNAQVGATHFRGNYDPIFQIAYDSELSEVSRLRASLRRAAVTDDDGDEAINTDVTASYSRQIGRASTIGSNFRYRASEVQTGDDEDAKSISFGIDYSRQIGNDISLVAGANIIRSEEQNGEREDDERVFLGLSRTFDFLP